ncbi:unnamed protein product [marine sediment metagenome]|uniref:Undecaprenyl diphosphate synthase n=1 Tax=marine sediment metagenome TaxID=412755 RepID=X1N168_9ZZZZ
MSTSLPQHIAIIMDGNGRWAKKRLLSRIMGHRAGVESVREIVSCCASKQITALTIFAFSSENWQRPSSEVKGLMELFMKSLDREVASLHKNNVKMDFIGDLSAFSSALQQRMAEAKQTTKNNTGLYFTIAVNYGGCWDITQATKIIASKVAAGELTPEDINQAEISKHLCCAALPPPDLFIRTSGECRISNFFLWQLAYTELYFTPTPWPEFRREALDAALEDYAKRQRRYGKLSEQLDDSTQNDLL